MHPLTTAIDDYVKAKLVETLLFIQRAEGLVMESAKEDATRALYKVEEAILYNLATINGT